MNKHLYIIAGCNGAGKTTASFAILPDSLNCKEFVNADEIARGLSPFQPEKVAIEAGRIMLHRINDLLNEQANFAFETTLATKSYKATISRAKAAGYNVTLLFFWLQTTSLAKERVKKRVADAVLIFDNSEGKQELIAEKTKMDELYVIDNEKFKKLKYYYDNTRKN